MFLTNILDKFSSDKMKMKMLKHCDWNYKNDAVNFTNVTNIEIKTEKEYYTSYYDVFGDTCDDEKDKKECGYDYGQCWDRQSLRKDFNPELTKSKVLHYNDKKRKYTNEIQRRQNYKRNIRLYFKYIHRTL